MFSKIKIRFQIFNLQLNQSVASKQTAVVPYGHSFAHTLPFVNYGVLIADNESYTVLQAFKVLLGIFAADVHHSISSFLDFCIRSNAEILKLLIRCKITYGATCFNAIIYHFRIHILLRFAYTSRGFCTWPSMAANSSTRICCASLC